MASELADVHLRWKGRHIENFTTQADLDDPEDLQGLLEGAIRRDKSNRDRHISEYEVDVRGKVSRKRITYVGRSR